MSYFVFHNRLVLMTIALAIVLVGCAGLGRSTPGADSRLIRAWGWLSDDRLCILVENDSPDTILVFCGGGSQIGWRALEGSTGYEYSVTVFDPILKEVRGESAVLFRGTQVSRFPRSSLSGFEVSIAFRWAAVPDRRFNLIVDHVEEPRNAY